MKVLVQDIYGTSAVLRVDEVDRPEPASPTWPEPRAVKRLRQTSGRRSAESPLATTVSSWAPKFTWVSRASMQASTCGRTAMI
jgi:hypothetical protein